MTIVVIFIVALSVLGSMAALFSMKDGGTVTASGDCLSCSGQSAGCRQSCMMKDAAKDTEYYDDEELDAFCGKDSGDYTDEEAKLFREVLHSMRQEDVAGWSRSLVLRGINVPNQIKDELVMMTEG